MFHCMVYIIMIFFLPNRVGVLHPLPPGTVVPMSKQLGKKIKIQLLIIFKNYYCCNFSYDSTWATV